MRFVFSPPTEEAAGLLTLPWTQPLEDWQDPRLVEIRQRGISRHIVRFVADNGELCALLHHVPGGVLQRARRPAHRPVARRLGRVAGAAAPGRVTREELLHPDDQRFRIANRLRRLNELGFDVDEVELISTPDGNRLRLRTRVAESGHHSRQLFLRTGLTAEENQARRLPPAEIFHEILEHRWYMSEAAGTDVGTTAAAQSYFQTVLPDVPELLSEDGPDEDAEMLS